MSEILVNLCQCNNCGGIFIDQDSKTNDQYLVQEGKYTNLQYKEDVWVCPVCDTDGYLTENILKADFNEKKVETKTADQIIASIGEVLAEASPAMLVEIANKVLAEKVQWHRDGLNSTFITIW